MCFNLIDQCIENIVYIYTYLFVFCCCCLGEGVLSFKNLCPIHLSILAIKYVQIKSNQQIFEKWKNKRPRGHIAQLSPIG